MARVSLTLPDELIDRATAAGVSIAAVCEVALRDALGDDAAESPGPSTETVRRAFSEVRDGLDD